MRSNSTKDFLKIVAENPDLPIFASVDSEVVYVGTPDELIRY